jgi:hypothetical protein
MNKELQDLHPKIKKFWLEKYKQISCNEHFGKGGIEWYAYNFNSQYSSYNGFLYKYVIAFSDLVKDWETTYYFEGVEYSEEVMLRLIEMKSFA